MSHLDSNAWAPIQEADGASVCHPSIVSDAGKVLTVAWQGNVADTNRLMRQLCAFPELAAALEAIIAHESHLINPHRVKAAREALAKLGG